MKRKISTKRIELRADRELYHMLKAEADEMGIPLAEAIRRIFRQYFDEKSRDAEDDARYQAILEEVGEEMDKSMLEFIAELEEKRRSGIGEGKQ